MTIDAATVRTMLAAAGIDATGLDPEAIATELTERSTLNETLEAVVRATAIPAAVFDPRW